MIKSYPVRSRLRMRPAWYSSANKSASHSPPWRCWRCYSSKARPPHALVPLSLTLSIRVTPPTPQAKGRNPLKSAESNPSLITRLASVFTTTSGMVQAKVTLNVSNPPCHANANGTLARWACHPGNTLFEPCRRMFVPKISSLYLPITYGNLYFCPGAWFKLG